MNDNIDDEIKKRMQKIFPTPEVASAMVDITVHGRPIGWGTKSNAPYYKERYAKQIKPEVDKMIKTGDSICWQYSVWCGEGGMSRNTLYNRINQSIRYLIERMDDIDHTYARWYESVRVSRDESSGGVLISYVKGFAAGEDFSSVTVKEKEFVPQWQKDMDEWLEADTKKPFIAEGLILSPEEIKEWKLHLSGLANIQFSISHKSVKIIKMNV